MFCMSTEAYSEHKGLFVTLVGCIDVLKGMGVRFCVKSMCPVECHFDLHSSKIGCSSVGAVVAIVMVVELIR